MKTYQAGATAVEFALVTMLFATFFLGVVDMSRLLWTWNAASEATRLGARTAVVCDKDAERVVHNMQIFLPQLLSDNVNLTWYQYDPTQKIDVVSSTCDHTNCSGVSVQLQNFQFQWLSPIGFATRGSITMPGFSTYLPREVMGQDPDSASICS